MKTLSKKQVLVFVISACLLCLSATIILIIGNNSNSTKQTHIEKMELQLSSTEVKGKVRTEITLPSVTVLNVKDKNLQDSVRIKMLFVEDSRYVLPAKNANEGVLLSENTTYTPTKCGTYKITYFVENADGEKASVEAKMLVEANLDDPLGYNLAGKTQLDNWIIGQDKQNSCLNEYGEIVIAGKEGRHFTGAVYKGEKIQNGDTVAFSFRAEPLESVMFYNVSFLVTPSCDESEPTYYEGTWPKYFNMRIYNKIATYAVTVNNENFGLLGNLSLNLCDGKEHTIAINIVADEEEIVTNLWVDTDVTEEATATGTIKKTDVASKYGQNSEHLKIFNKNISGWLSFGANVVDPDTSNDGMTIKALSINGSNALLSPEIKVAAFDKMLVNKTITLPEVKAKDMNDYSDISSDVKVYVKMPGTDFVEYTAKEYTPTHSGTYVFRYLVTDRNGIQAYEEYSVDCAKGESDVPPVILFGAKVKDKYVVTVGEKFTIPVTASVKDSFGDDITSRLKVSLTGREKAELTAGQVFCFYSIGENTLRYEVKDYNGNISAKEIKIQVTGKIKGNILDYPSAWFFGKNSALKNNMLIVDDTTAFAFGAQKIYDEKVRMLMKYVPASGVGTGDGTELLLINLRGGSNAKKTIKTESNPNGTASVEWPDGVVLQIHSKYGIGVKAAGYEGASYGGAKLSKSVRDIFYNKEVELAFQTTDVYEGDEFKGVLFELWINGTKMTWSGTAANKDGDLFLSNRLVGANPNVLQAGWLDFYMNGSNTKNGNRTQIYSITLDGSKPLKLEVSADKKDNQTCAIGEIYTLPVVTVKLGGSDISSKVKKFIWINGTDKPDLSGNGYTEKTIVPNETHVKGFQIIYVYDGKEILTIPVVNTTKGTNVTSQGKYTEKNRTWVYSEKKIYNSMVSVTFKLNEQLPTGKWIDFGIRGNDQKDTSKFSWQKGLVLRILNDAKWGIGVKVGHSTKGNYNVDNRYVGWDYDFSNVDWTKEHTLTYIVEDVYKNDVFMGIQMTFKFDGEPVKLLAYLSGTSNPDGNKTDVFVPKDILSLSDTDSTVNDTTGSYMFVRYEGGAGFSVTDAYLLSWGESSDDENKENDGGEGKDDNDDGTGDNTGNDSRENIVSEMTVLNNGKTWSYVAQKIYNSEVEIGFKLNEQLPSGAWVDFGVRGNAQESNSWFNYQKGLLIRLRYDPTWGIGVKVGHSTAGNYNVNTRYVGWDYDFTGVDWTQEHTIKYVVEDVYENNVFTGIRMAFEFDGEPVKLLAYLSGTTNPDSKKTDVFVPKAILSLSETDLTINDTTASYMFVRGENGVTGLTVTKAYLTSLDDNAGDGAGDNTGNDSRENIVSEMTVLNNGKTWSYVAQKIYNSEVEIGFKLNEQLPSGAWVDFGVRGNAQEANSWFNYQKGLLIRLRYDPTWGIGVKVGHSTAGNYNVNTRYVGWDYDFSNVDWTKEHTIKYVVEDVYENNVFTGIRMAFEFDGKPVKLLAYLSGTTNPDGNKTDVFVPKSILSLNETDLTINDTTASYMFVRGENGVTGLTVTKAYLTSLDDNAGDGAGDNTGNDSRENIVSEMTVLNNGKTWSYVAQKIYNSEVEIGFKLNEQLPSGAWVDFGVRGNAQEANSWFNYQKGLLIRLRYDPTWGIGVKVGHSTAGNYNINTRYVGWDYDFTSVDWTREHTIKYVVEDVYENNVFTGIRMAFEFDGEPVKLLAYLSGTTNPDSKKTDVFVPKAILSLSETDLTINDTTASYMFVRYEGAGTGLTVIKAYIK